MGTRVDSVSGGWMKKPGMVVTPASTKPLTPSFVSSKCWTSLVLSLDTVLILRVFSQFGLESCVYIMNKDTIEVSAG